MKIQGIGVDIERVSRFRGKKNTALERTIFTARERTYCDGKRNRAECFAARFAAKEAVIKSTAGRVRDMKKIEITHRRNGQPVVRVSGATESFLISLSHTKEYAIAFALWYR